MSMVADARRTQVPRDYQDRAVAATFASFTDGYRAPLLVMPTGCHREGTPILMFNGTVRDVEDVEAGDLLMGPDNLPRVVLQLARGQGRMVKVVPTKGEAWVVNEDHILTLVRTNEKSGRNKGGRVIDVSVREWLTWPKWRKHIHKLFRVAVDFPIRQRLPLEPYFVGVLLGDGGSTQGTPGVTTADGEVQAEVGRQAAMMGLGVADSPAGGRSRTFRLTTGKRRGQKRAGRNAMTAVMKRLGIHGKRAEDKAIPQRYALASKSDRLELLAGLMDTDGTPSCGGYDYISKSRMLAGDVAFVARSVGLAAYVSPSWKRAQTGPRRRYWRVSISGDCGSIPCRIPAKRLPPRRQKKSALRTGFTVEPLGVEPYYGFTLSGDGRYVLGDFTVTHNTGKTNVMGYMLDKFLRTDRRRALLLAHREELISQSADRFELLTGHMPAVEMGEQKAHAKAAYFGDVDRIVCASVQSLCRPARLSKYNPEDFGIVFIDEAHHAIPRNKQYYTIYEYFRRNLTCFVVGVTATPDRADEEALGQVFDCCPFDYQLADAIGDGYLVPIRQSLIVVEDLDFSKISTEMGDLSAGELEEAMMEEKVMHRVVTPTLELCKQEPTIIFTAGVAHAHAVAEICNRKMPGSAVSLDGKTDRDIRRQEIRRFKRGEFNYLVNCGLFLEGFDADIVQNVVVARPTKSRSLYAQMIGRGTRVLPGTIEGYGEDGVFWRTGTPGERQVRIAGSRKPFVRVIDFEGNSGRHKLVHASDVLGGKESDEIVDRARDITKERAAAGLDIDALDALNEARREAELARRERRKRVIAQAVYFQRDIDPFDLLEVSPGREAGYARKPASPAQKSALRRAGLRNIDGLSMSKASKLLDEIKDRQQQGLCSPKQASLLAAYGRDTRVSYEQAAEAIQTINTEIREAKLEQPAKKGRKK